MTILNYVELAAQFFFKKAHSFSFRLGPDKVVVEVVSSSAPTVPVSISFGQALQLVDLIQGNATATPFTSGFVIGGNIEVTVTVSKI